MATNTTGAAHKELSDAEIATRIAAGDQSAFVLLMRRFNRPLYRTARCSLKDDTEAEDVLQEAYLLIYRGIKSFRGDAKLLTWLTRLVVNEAIARSRKTARQAEVIQLGDVARDADAEGDNVNDATFRDPQQAAMLAQARGLLEKKIDALPDVFRTDFVLRGLEEMTVAEVAICLGIPEATVRTWFFRARSLLRESLSREIDFAFEGRREAIREKGAPCAELGLTTRSFRMTSCWTQCWRIQSLLTGLSS